MNLLAEYTRLSLARPSSDAGAAAVAAWYRSKARLHAYVAATGGADAARERAYAAAAEEHAQRLLAGVPGADLAAAA